MCSDCFKGSITELDDLTASEDWLCPIMWRNWKEFGIWGHTKEKNSRQNWINRLVFTCTAKSGAFCFKLFFLNVLYCNFQCYTRTIWHRQNGRRFFTNFCWSGIYRATGFGLQLRRETTFVSVCEIHRRYHKFLFFLLGVL